MKGKIVVEAPALTEKPITCFYSSRHCVRLQGSPPFPPPD